MIQWLHFPMFIKWYVTGVCNLRCSHCYLTDYTKKPPLDLCLAIADYLGKKNVIHASLLGGEPLARSDLEQVVAKLVQGGIKIKIATNGTLIDFPRAQSLVGSGVTDFQVSVEGHSAELSDPIRGRGTFPKILEGVSNLKRAGARVALGLTISRQNAPHIDRIFHFALESGADQLKLSAFVPIGTGKLSASELMLDRETVLQVRGRLSELAASYPSLPINSVFLPKSKDKCDNCVTRTFGCGAGTNSLVINSDLTLSACDILIEEDRTTKRISKPSEIAELWLDDQLFNKWRGVAPGRTSSISSFANVHKQSCHVATSTYGADLFA